LLLVVGEDPERFLLEYRPRTSPLSADHSCGEGVGVQVILRYRESVADLLSVERWETPHFDINRLHRWISACDEQTLKETRFIASPSYNTPPGFMLIDVGQLCITSLQRHTPYVALSYPWSCATDGPDVQLLRRNLEFLRSRGSLSKDRLPQLIWDCISLCRSLGIRYLWVDRLCIVQDDLEMKLSQVNAMADIYQGASWTLVAAIDPGGDIGLPGGASRPRKNSTWNRTRRFRGEQRVLLDNKSLTVDKSFWSQRAWTFQERLLSRRCLIITEWETYFLCPHSHSSEGEDDDHEHHVSIGFERTKSSALPADERHEQLASGVDNMMRYCTCVERYTLRNLTYDEDILRAFAGVGQVISSNLNTHLVYGLPAKDLIHAMLWSPIGYLTRRESTPEIPSWSWAAWLGAVRWERLFSERIDGLHGHLAFGMLVCLQIMSDSGTLVPLELFDGFFFDAEDVDGLAKRLLETHPCRRLGYAAYVSDTIKRSRSVAEMWKRCPHNHWEAALHRDVTRETQRAASLHPGALVFNSTSALLRLQRSDWTNRTEVGRRRHLWSVVQDDMKWNESRTQSVYTHLDICDQQSNVVGTLMGMTEQSVEELLRRGDRQEFVVLCAGVLPEEFCTSIEEDENYRWVDDYSLHVMAIQRDEQHPNVVSRIAIGTIEARCWGQCNPSWQAFILI
jgi:hypothetical protein